MPGRTRTTPEQPGDRSSGRAQGLAPRLDGGRKLAANGYDVPVGYVLVVDGAISEGILDGNWQDARESPRDWNYEFMVEIPDGARVSLRPVYSISG